MVFPPRYKDGLHIDPIYNNNIINFNTRLVDVHLEALHLLNVL